MTMTLNVLGDGSIETCMTQLQIGQQNSSAQNKSSSPTMLQHTTDASKENADKNNDDATTSITDADIITDRLQRAQILEEECKIFDAAALLDGIDPKHFQRVHHDILKEAKLFRHLLDDSSSPITASSTDDDDKHKTDQWIKQGEQHGSRHDFAIYYKLTPTNQITCRIETPIEPTLLIPILSVLNESELYKTWIPQYRVPRLEVVKSEKLVQSGRVSQVILVETEVPWPIARRELILKAVACDDIVDLSDDSSNTNNDNSDDSGDHDEEKRQMNGSGGNTSRILVRIQSLDCEDDGEDGLEILPAKKGVRIKVDGGFVFEKCPVDHPMAKKKKSSSNDNSNNNDDDLILLTFTFSVDPKLSILPQPFLNFFLRVAMRQIWGMFLHVAEEVGDGKRPEHSEVIERKREELYDWVEERTSAMLRRELRR